MVLLMSIKIKEFLYNECVVSLRSLLKNARKEEKSTYSGYPIYHS